MTAQDHSSERQYRKLLKVGRGGMGDVHLALSTGHGAFRKLVVLKCRRVPLDEQADRRRMFLEEGRLAALLNHPNIVQTYDVGQLDGTDYIAMEFLEGQPVSHLSAKAGGLSPRLVAYIAEQVLRGLHYAQELRDLDGTPLNVIHRDLSPENIFVTYDGAVKVLDFGIAKSDARSREVTEAGVLKGKLSYMAPEQVEAFTADRRTDIFVLGMVMWELLTGKRLNAHRSAVDQFRWLTEGKVPSLMTMMDVDPELDAIVQTACQRKPQSRYASAQEMRHALEAYLSRNGGGGAAEHLSRVMVVHFGRLRDSMRAHVQQRIRELEAGGAETTAIDEAIEADRSSEITHIVQHSDLIADEAGYRTATTGRVALPRKSVWPAWVAASCVAALGLGWFQYARTVGTESVVFRLLPDSGVSPVAAPPVPSSVNPTPAMHAAPLPPPNNEASSSGPERSGADGAERPPVTPTQSAGAGTSSPNAVARSVATRLAPAGARRSAAPKDTEASSWDAVDVEPNVRSRAGQIRDEPLTPPVDAMLPSRVPMVD